MRMRLGLAVAAFAMLGGCAYDDYGYGGVSAGYGVDGGYDDYYGSGYDPYYPSYGWYDGYYYPGNGYYVFDRGGKRYQMRDRDRQHWHRNRDGRQRDARRRDDRSRNWNGATDGQRRDGNWNRDRADGQRREWRRDRMATPDGTVTRERRDRGDRAGRPDQPGMNQGRAFRGYPAMQPRGDGAQRERGGRAEARAATPRVETPRSEPRARAEGNPGRRSGWDQGPRRPKME
jgi:hypothetical protein